jgi:hypothetical protein
MCPEKTTEALSHKAIMSVVLILSTDRSSGITHQTSKLIDLMEFLNVTFDLIYHDQMLNTT